MAGYEFFRATVKLYEFNKAYQANKKITPQDPHQGEYEIYLQKLRDDLYFKALKFIVFTIFALNPHLTLGTVCLLAVNAICAFNQPAEHDEFLPRKIVGSVSAFFRSALYQDKSASKTDHAALTPQSPVPTQ